MPLRAGEPCTQRTVQWQRCPPHKAVSAMEWGWDQPCTLRVVLLNNQPCQLQPVLGEHCHYFCLYSQGHRDPSGTKRERRWTPLSFRYSCLDIFLASLLLSTKGSGVTQCLTGISGHPPPSKIRGYSWVSGIVGVWGTNPLKRCVHFRGQW